MVLTLVVKSWEGTVVLVSLVGCSWAATQWIPHAIIGAEISPKHDMDDTLLEHRGAILGLHNLAISGPQIVAASASSGIMWLMTAAGSVEPAVWPLRVAALPAMIAATLACGLDA
jgi:solute carrier family 45 protein 1/2/4